MKGSENMGMYKLATKMALEKFKQSTGYKEGKLSSKEEGYVYDVRDNLFDYQRSYNAVAEKFIAAQGNELHSKMCAVHSSSALVVNAFAYFIGKEDQLVFNRQQAFTKIEFEKQLLVGVNNRTKANIDLYLENDKHVFIESKFLEPLKKTTPKFAESYFNKDIAERTKRFTGDLKPMYFDWAQMTKHYLAIESNKDKSKNTTLIYLYWTPLNVNELTTYETHEKELAIFQNKCDELKSETEITFKSMTYAELFNKWDNKPNLKAHVAKLRERYSFAI
jgi:hypothetical protein